jgi:hypothetical protein
MAFATLKRAALASCLTFGLAICPVRAEVKISRLNIGLPNTIVLKLTGSYSGDEILRVKSAIAELPPATRVIAALDSGGGLVGQGIELGKFFYASRIPTLVMAGDECASACTHAFFGGRDPLTNRPLRILANGGKLGFHNFKSNGIEDRPYTAKEMQNMSRATQQLVAEELKYYQEIEAPIEAILLLHNKAKSDDMLWLDASDSLSFGVTVLNRDLGRLITPDSLDERRRRKTP